MRPRFILIAITSLVLGACAKDPGTRFYELESELIDRVAPFKGAPDKAAEALCAWLLANRARISETVLGYAAYIAELKLSKDEVELARLGALGKAQRPRHFEITEGFYENERWMNATTWFVDPDMNDLDAACAK